MSRSNIPAALSLFTSEGTTALPSTHSNTAYHKVQVDGVGIFYREAGPKDAPTIVLLHGFPSSSRMFDTLIPLLATRYHVVAPDYPGFGQSDAPPPSHYRYTFDHLAETTNRLLEQLNIDRYSLYLQDYGGPIGFRVMLAHPARVQGLIIQNANSYEEGLGPKWKGIKDYWADPKAHPEVPEAFMSLEGTKFRHAGDSPNPERYNPDTQSVCQHVFSGMAAVVSSMVLIEVDGRMGNFEKLAGLSMLLMLVQTLFLFWLMKKLRNPQEEIEELIAAK